VRRIILSVKTASIFAHSVNRLAFLTRRKIFCMRLELSIQILFSRSLKKLIKRVIYRILSSFLVDNNYNLERTIFRNELEIRTKQ
jgi:hypothetical protein